MNSCLKSELQIEINLQWNHYRYRFLSKEEQLMVTIASIESSSEKNLSVEFFTKLENN